MSKATQSNLVSVGQQFSGLPVKDLIGAPLMAAAEANNMMAVTQTKFLLDTCFQKNGEGDKARYTPIQVTMESIRNVLVPDADGNHHVQEIATTFNIPLMTLVPINSLGVDDVNVDFKMEVKSSFSETANESSEENLATSGSFETKVGFGFLSTTVSGNVSYDSTTTSSHESHYNKSNAAEYGIKVHAGQIPLPNGVTTLIDALTKDIAPIQTPVTKNGNSADKEAGEETIEEAGEG